MPVTTSDIKVRASQRLTDETDGGGYMTATEIVDRHGDRGWGHQ